MKGIAMAAPPIKLKAERLVNFVIFDPPRIFSGVQYACFLNFNNALNKSSFQSLTALSV